MENSIELPGFKITVASVAANNTDPGAIPILAGQLALKIKDFFETRLAHYGAVTIRLSIENWDEIFEVEETTFDVHCSGSNVTSDQYPRNYWIETQ
ncbi:hypothetical protein FPZ43_14320 [Mucilaginibacter pallidiroseus]|uniref:Uncharacterized protein n=1 Tax=Mucilaginibacter pallidiroseus TaxID=2599295 RepID=A0A563U4T0_9SPHI|nr:hypothetical protein [Mucilaginibacter pallidiroseus]TWR26337.1 hypothetical protein FPZ43_14320 [Mucilaginibacter pallidiroseus]